MNDNECDRWAMDRLPFPYAEALRLRAAGVAEDVIARVLDLDADAVGSVLTMAEQKLATIRATEHR